MGFLKRLLGREGHRTDPQDEPLDPPCPHVALVPHWERSEDIGNADRVSYYLCEACKATVSRGEGDEMVAQAGELLRR